MQFEEYSFIHVKTKMNTFKINGSLVKNFLSCLWIFSFTLNEIKKIAHEIIKIFSKSSNKQVEGTSSSLKYLQQSQYFNLKGYYSTSD